MKNYSTHINYFILLSIVILFTHCSFDERYYKSGVDALSRKDTVEAEQMFKHSARTYKDTGSVYELAMLQLKRGTINTRREAYENLHLLTLREPRNLKFRYAFADLCKEFARLTAISEYKDILEIDSNQTKAWFELAKQEAKEFEDFNNSVRVEDEFIVSLQDFANEDFTDSEKYFKKAIQLDSLNRDVLFQFALLYEKAGKYIEAITILNKLLANKISDKEIHLALGLLFYKTNRLKESYGEYKIALDLMTEKEREDFTYKSVKLLIEPVFEGIVDTNNEYELKEFIELYWKVFDPLYMTDYNERLLEHYSRVAFANLHFSVPKMGIEGWKTNRGETVIRFGEPINKTRIRPSMGGFDVMMKTEVWNYPDMTFGFTDLALNNNFRFAAPAGEKDKVRPQFAGDTHSFAEYLRKVRYYLYDPKFEGPKFDVPFNYAQFKNYEKRNHTNLYINFGLFLPDSLKRGDDSTKSFEVGFVLFDKFNFDKLISVSKTIKNLSPFLFKADSLKHQMHQEVLNISARADSGTASFEILRRADKGVFASKGNLTIRKFSNNSLDLSDLIFASKVGSRGEIKGIINRDDISIIPLVQNNISTGEPLFIYYEVYNLRKGTNGLTDFEQSISISPVDERSDFSKAISSVGKFLGLKGDDKITLKSRYQTLEADPKIYLQLDMNEYESGKYEIVVEIKDNFSGKVITTSNKLTWVK